MAQDLQVDVRQETGRRKVKRLRAAGKIPAVVYGHGEESVSLAVPKDEFNKIINLGDRIVSFSGGVSGDAFIRDVQWDVFGTQVIHIDFTRVAKGEMISTTVKLELRGVAPGTKMGGTVEQSVSTMELLCPPRSMTDKVEVNINELELDQTITIAHLELPEGSKAVLEPDTVIVQCIEKVAVADKDEPDGPEPPTGAEPEVIGQKDEEGGDAS